jgi:hypothetical protein
MNNMRLKFVVNNLNRGQERPVFQVTSGDGITFLGVVVYAADQLASYMTNNPKLTETQAVFALVAEGLAHISNMVAKTTNNLMLLLTEGMDDNQAVETLTQASVIGH